MADNIHSKFLESQLKEGLALAAGSDIVRIAPVFGAPPTKYIAAFHCKGMVRGPDAGIHEAGEFHFGIAFAPDHLRTVRPPELVTILHPLNIWHPNIIGPAICLGHLNPGVTLVELLHQIYELLTFQNFASHDGLNPAACEWARHNQERFPLERRPLRRPAARQRAAAPPTEGATS